MITKFVIIAIIAVYAAAVPTPDGGGSGPPTPSPDAAPSVDPKASVANSGAVLPPWGAALGAGSHRRFFRSIMPEANMYVYLGDTIFWSCRAIRVKLCPNLAGGKKLL